MLGFGDSSGKALWAKRGAAVIGSENDSFGYHEMAEGLDEVPQQEVVSGHLRPKFAPGAHPRLVALSSHSAKEVPALWIRVDVQMQLSVAFVHIEGEWVFDSPVDADAEHSRSKTGFVLEMPKKHSATINYTSAELESGPVFEAHIVEQTAALSGYKSNEGRGMALAMRMYRERSGHDPSEFNPELFSFPFHGLSVGEKVRIRIDYMENLAFDAGSYSLAVPLDLSPQFLAGKALNDVLDVRVSLDLPRCLLPLPRGSDADDSASADSASSAPAGPAEASGSAPAGAADKQVALNPASQSDGSVSDADVDAELSPWSSRGPKLVLDSNPPSFGAGGAAQVNEAMTRVHLMLDRTNPDNCPGELQVSYVGWASDIQCQGLHDTRPSKELVKNKVVDVAGGVVSVFIAPPKPTANNAMYPRDVVFLLDRSGSMGFTNVFPSAQRALIAALRELRPEDRFAICCFDDRQVWFGGCCPEPSDEEVERLLAKLAGSDSELSAAQRSEAAAAGASKDARWSSWAAPISVFNPASDAPKHAGGAPAAQGDPKRSNPVCVRAKPEYVARAIEWVKGIEPAGLTDILSPLKQAMWGLFNSDEAIAGASKRLKSVFLITDGAVEEEREICWFAGRISAFARVFTFGIGVDCNSYFLRKLASVGRGYADVCFLREGLVPQMLALFANAQLPVLKDVRVELVHAAAQADVAGSAAATSSVQSLFWCPEKVPDLYCHAPLFVSCSYRGVLGAGTIVRVSGTLPGGAEWCRQVPLQATSAIPLRKVFAQQYVEALVADAWFADLKSEKGEQLRRRCVDVAVAESIPCPHTQMVAVQYSRDEFDSSQARAADERERRLRFKLPTNHKFVLLGASIVGLAAFGSIAGTLAGGMAGIGDAAPAGELGAAAADGGGGCCNGGCCDCCDCGHCGDCGDCDGCSDGGCDDCDCGDCLDCLGDMA